jgi:hypothetical protein
VFRILEKKLEHIISVNRHSTTLGSWTLCSSSSSHSELLEMMILEDSKLTVANASSLAQICMSEEYV